MDSSSFIPTKPSVHSEIGPSSVGMPQPIATKLKEVGVTPDQAVPIFPKPSGQFPVGIESYVLQDSDRSIGISVHYPSNVGTSFRHHPLVPYINELCKADPYMRIERYANCCSSAQPDASPIRESFPVIIMAHGFGMCSDDYQPIVEELASHGFCVITVESQGVAGYSRALESQGKPQINAEFSDEEAMQLEIKDLKCVLKTLKDFQKINPELAASMDLEKIGIMGHSIGGAAAAQICRNDVSVKAGMNLDGKLLGEHATGAIFQPFVTIQCDRAAAVLENLIPDVKTSMGLSEQARLLRDGGDSDQADALELQAKDRLEDGLKGAENYLDPIAEFDTFTTRAGAGSYQVVLNGSRHHQFGAVRSLAIAVGLSETAGPDQAMYKSWEKELPAERSTWAATNRHILSFFSEQFKGISTGIKSRTKIEDSI